MICLLLTPERVIMETFAEVAQFWAEEKGVHSSAILVTPDSAEGQIQATIAMDEGVAATINLDHAAFAKDTTIAWLTYHRPLLLKRLAHVRDRRG